MRQERLSRKDQELVRVVRDHGPTGRDAAPFLIHDRDGKYPELFETILADTGIKVVLTGVRTPRMNVGHGTVDLTCRRELLDRRSRPRCGTGIAGAENQNAQYRPGPSVDHAQPLLSRQKRLRSACGHR
ncbi:hypothetical protein ACTMS0_28860 [Micromonospora sp. H33]|uniref:hypothetical protein n=1 Tax=Micromonospora sp. H33 TaxID=3452215 RepID=UPI003F8C90EF